MSQVKPFVTLIRYTQNPEETIAMAARLCYSDADIMDIKNNTESKDNAKFIGRLLSMGHLSAFEHASFTFGIEGISRALLAQITRHRIASFSVKSQRYVSATKEDGNTFNYIIPPAIEELGKEAVDKYNNQMATIQEWYTEWQVALGNKGESSNEDARFILPNASETKMVITMNARELLHFFNLRCCNRAQWEIREVAWQMLKEVSEIAPNIFKDAGPSCIAGKCSEGVKTCGKMNEVKERKRSL